MLISFITNTLMYRFIKKVECIQNKTAITITREIRRSSRDKLYQKLALEQLENRRYYGKFSSSKIFKKRSAEYLFRIIQSSPVVCNTRTTYIILLSILETLFLLPH